MGLAMQCDFERYLGWPGLERGTSETPVYFLVERSRNDFPLSFPLTLTLSPKVLPVTYFETLRSRGGNTLGERGL